MKFEKNAEIARRVRIVFVRSLALDLDPDDPSLERDLGSVAGLDSLARLEFVAGLENEFGIEIEPERLNIAFLSDLRAVTEYLAARLLAGS